jgi:hypothetical protein
MLPHNHTSGVRDYASKFIITLYRKYLKAWEVYLNNLGIGLVGCDAVLSVSYIST